MQIVPLTDKSLSQVAVAKPSDILIVDDTAANLRVLTEILGDSGYRSRFVTNGKAALQAARAAAPDLVLLDINMPGMNGYEVCECFKADPALHGIPIIFLSALQETGDKVRAFQVGGVDYITKPFNAEEVRARVQTHLELQRQKRLLEEVVETMTRAERLRDNLTHMVVHDMKSPLATIAGYLALLEDHEVKLSTNGLNFIAEARRSIGRLIETVNSMLLISRLEAGELRLDRSECDLQDLTRSILADFEPLLGARQWAVDASSTAAIVYADPTLISRVIQNLVENAIRFTPADGSVRISLSDSSESVRFAITDTGPGIPTEHQSKIFEKFGQVENVDARAGTGLGLFFCEMAVELHGGRIGVQSTEGQGSTFWFTLPAGCEPN